MATVDGGALSASTIVSNSRHFVRQAYSRMHVDLSMEVFGPFTIDDELHVMDQQY